MKKISALLLTASLMFGAMPTRAAGNTSPGLERIVAVVNNDAITGYELAAREKLLIASSGLPDTPDVEQKLRDETLDTLIEEKLMVQAAKKNDIVVNKDEIADGFATVAKQNQLTPEQFHQMLAQSGIPASTLENEVEAQVAWGKVVQKVVRPNVDVSDTETDDGLARQRASNGKTQYLLAEIYLPVASPQEEDSVRQLAARLEGEIRQGHTPFQRVANQFSQAPGAEKGGNLGWVQEDQLDPAIDRALSGMNENDLSQPVRTAGGYHIILLRKKETATDANMPSRDDMRQKIGMNKLDRAQRRYMQEQKASSFIERR